MYPKSIHFSLVKLLAKVQDILTLIGWQKQKKGILSLMSVKTLNHICSLNQISVTNLTF